MKKILLILLVLLALVFILDKRFAFFSQPVQPGEMVGTSTEPVTGERPQQVSYRIEEVVTGLKVPWSIVFTSPDRMLVAERDGTIRVVNNGSLVTAPLHTFSEVSVGGEEGLMSLALHPEYVNNKFIYASLAYEAGENMYVKVVRFKDEGDRLTEQKVIIDKIPGARFHAGSRIAFGPDRKLYITTGDATDKNLAQRMNSLAGKLLRLNDDGTVPADNPFVNGVAGARAELWSIGHRNSQGIAWHSVTGELYSTEHGPSVFDGPAGGDEVNRIVKGGNYGWPLVSHDKTREGTVSPLVTYTPAEAPGSAMIYSGDVFPQFKNNLFFGALKGEGLMRIVLDENNPDVVVSYEKLPEVRYGRIREVTQGPDGFIYFTTSNRDGRGNPAAADDRIFRLVPER